MGTDRVRTSSAQILGTPHLIHALGKKFNRIRLFCHLLMDQLIPHLHPAEKS